MRFVLSTILSEKGVGLFSPAVQAIVSPVPDELKEEEQQEVWTSAGFIREYSLVTLKEESDEPPLPN